MRSTTEESGSRSVWRWSDLSQVVIISASRIFDGQQSFISIFTDDATNSSFCASNYLLSRDDAFTAGLPASSFFFGSMLGGLLLSTLADSKLGRKKMLLVSSLTMSVAALATVFAGNSIWIYSFFKFVSGFGRGSIGSCVTVLLMEITPRTWRGWVGVAGFLCFTLGFLSLPAIAYLNRTSSWRLLYIWTSLPGILYSFIIHVCVSESSRWLHTQATSNLSPENTTTTAAAPLLFDHHHHNYNSSMRELFGRRWAILRICSITIICFGIGMAYYGMPFGVKHLGFDEYLSVTLNAVLEIPTYLVTVYALQKFNRRTSLLAFCVLSGMFSISCSFVHENVKLGVELLAFFNVITACNIVLIYVTELFPTCVRNSASAVASQALVLGGVFSPQLAAAGKNSVFMSYGVFGLVILCCGFFVIYLPETKAFLSLCDTMAQQEELEGLILG